MLTEQKQAILAELKKKLKGKDLLFTFDGDNYSYFGKALYAREDGLWTYPSISQEAAQENYQPELYLSEHWEEVDISLLTFVFNNLNNFINNQ